jgi:hypothetical protein
VVTFDEGLMVGLRPEEWIIGTSDGDDVVKVKVV